jgi:hypothetical protein
MIMDIKGYWQYYSHRLPELDQLLETQVIFEDEDRQYSEKELVQLAVLNYKLNAVRNK